MSYILDELVSHHQIIFLSETWLLDYERSLLDISLPNHQIFLVSAQKHAEGCPFGGHAF